MRAVDIGIHNIVILLLCVFACTSVYVCLCVVVVRVLRKKLIKSASFIIQIEFYYNNNSVYALFETLIYYYYYITRVYIILYTYTYVLLLFF